MGVPGLLGLIEALGSSLLPVAAPSLQSSASLGDNGQDSFSSLARFTEPEPNLLTWAAPLLPQIFLLTPFLGASS